MGRGRATFDAIGRQLCTGRDRGLASFTAEPVLFALRNRRLQGDFTPRRSADMAARPIEIIADVGLTFDDVLLVPQASEIMPNQVNVAT